MDYLCGRLSEVSEEARGLREEYLIFQKAVPLVCLCKKPIALLLQDVFGRVECLAIYLDHVVEVRAGR